MIILIGGASHTGKTAYAQKLLETKRPYLQFFRETDVRGRNIYG